MTALREIRKHLGLSQRGIASMLQVTQAMVSFYETGENEFPPDKARLLIEYAGKRGLEISFNHIYGREALPCAAA